MYIGAFICEPMYYCRTREIFHTCFFLLCVVRAARGSAPPMTKGIVALEEAEKPSFPQKQHPTIIGFFHSFCDKPLTDSLSFSLPFTPLFSSVQFLLHCRHNRRRRQCGGDYSATDLRSVPASGCFFLHRIKSQHSVLVIAKLEC